MIATWKVDLKVGSLPEKVATAFGNLDLAGAEYTPIAYLGSQLVNGTNHAVLAEQLVTTGKDTKNIVLMIFNEKGMDCTLVNIERVLETGGEDGGVVIDVETELPADAKAVFDSAMKGFVGGAITPFAYLGTQITTGTDFIYATTVAPVGEYETKVVVLRINPAFNTLSFTDILNGNHLNLGGTFKL